MVQSNSLYRRLYRIFGYPLQALSALIIYGFYAILPPRIASSVGGWVGRTVGPHLNYHHRAIASIKRAFPHYSEIVLNETATEMWDNLGRVLAELPHLKRISEEHLEIVGEEHIAEVKKNGSSCIFFSGHFANWEVFTTADQKIGISYAQAYRAPNNQFIDAMLKRIRNLKPDDIIPKGQKGARAAIQALKSGRPIAMLVDQKMNDGIPVIFFGRNAMTAPALAQLSIRFNCPAIPARLERIKGCHFRLSFHPPLKIPDNDKVETMMKNVNDIFQEWISERPGQWLCWLHRRWPED